MYIAGMTAIEIKNGSPHTRTIEPAVARVVRAYSGRAAVISWNVFSVLWFRRHAPDIPRGLVVTSFWESRHFSNRLMVQAAHLLPAAALTDAHFLAHDVRHLPTHLSKRYRRRGKPVLTWTVRTTADRSHAAQYADAMIFEAPR
jgi:glycerophosphoryl diester phosphodiesterase